MRKVSVFALLGCAAMSLGLVSLADAAQKQTAAKQQTASGEAPNTASQPAQQPAPQNGRQPMSQKQASGQKTQAVRPPVIPPGYRLLTLSEGRALAQGIAWADDEEGLSPDCSHLVHTLYQQAGYPYPYASSLDLYRGSAPFLRVRYAHPGDLVVWRGHVGIIVNPREHSFFSTTSSGTRIVSYRSAYWRARGYPRFFRYLTKTPLKANGQATEAASQPPQH